MTRRRNRKKEPEGPLTYRVPFELVEYAFNLLSSLVDEAKIQITEEGWRIAVVDPAHVAMMEIKIPRHVFGPYAMAEGWDGEMVLDIDEIRADMKAYDSEEYGPRWIEFNVRPSSAKVEMTIGEITTFYDMEKNLLADPKIPNLKLPCEFLVQSHRLAQMMWVMEHHSAYVCVRSNPHDGKKKIEWIVINDNGILKARVVTNSVVENDCFTNLSMSYIGQFAKVINTWRDSVELTVELGKDYPVRITKPSNSKCAVGVMYLVAPRVESP